jgi:hypothetical protein
MNSIRILLKFEPPTVGIKRCVSSQGSWLVNVWNDENDVARVKALFMFV